MTNKTLNKLKKEFGKHLARCLVETIELEIEINGDCKEISKTTEYFDNEFWQWITKHFIPREEKMTVIHNPITDTYYKIKTKRVSGNSKGSIVRKWKQFKEKK